MARAGSPAPRERASDERENGKRASARVARRLARWTCKSSNYALASTSRPRLTRTDGRVHGRRCRAQTQLENFVPVRAPAILAASGARSRCAPGVRLGARPTCSYSATAAGGAPHVCGAGRRWRVTSFPDISSSRPRPLGAQRLRGDGQAAAAFATTLPPRAPSPSRRGGPGASAAARAELRRARAHPLLLSLAHAFSAARRRPNGRLLSGVRFLGRVFAAPLWHRVARHSIRSSSIRSSSTRSSIRSSIRSSRFHGSSIFAAAFAAAAF